MRQNRRQVYRGKIRRFLIGWPVVCLLIGTSCSRLEPNPRTMFDYDNSRGTILDYAPGDRFTTIKPMLLTKPVGTDLSLTKPGIGAPSLDQYARDPKRFGYVLKIVPAGTRLELVAIKDAGLHTPVVFVCIEGVDEWVGVTLDESTKVGVEHRLRYNREYFHKVGDSPSLPAEGGVTNGH